MLVFLFFDEALDESVRQVETDYPKMPPWASKFSVAASMSRRASRSIDGHTQSHESLGGG